MVGFGIDFRQAVIQLAAFKKGFEQMGGQMLQEVYTPMNSADFGPYLLR